jgi:hypothetical protein
MMRLLLIDVADYGVAHPDEGCADSSECAKCAIAIRPDTGELVLLWLCGGINWSLSRETPDYERHRRELDGFTV